MNYDELCNRLNLEFSKIENPKLKDIQKLSKEFNVDISIVRDCIGLKDDYDFLIDND